jgi:hypothetical protein
MFNRKKTNNGYKTLHRKLKIDHQEPHQNAGLNPKVTVLFFLAYILSENGHYAWKFNHF